jgi:DNA polymerase I-like protein with 3'-5' exonuclease and polymerase domains
VVSIPLVVDMTQVVHRYIQSYNVYIGRGSKWGNPFSHMSGTKALYRVKTREESIERFREWILTQAHLLQAILDGELDGKTLGCYCKPKACHGDVLVELRENKELVALSLVKLKKKIEEQKKGRTANAGPLSSEGIGMNVKNTPVVVKTLPKSPQAQYEQSYGASIGLPPIGTEEDYKRAAETEAKIQETEAKIQETEAKIQETMAKQTPTVPRKQAPAGLKKMIPKKNTLELSEPKKAVEKPTVATQPPKLTKAQAEVLLKGGEFALAQPMPKGYTAVGKNDIDLMLAIKAEHIKRQVCSLDYETDGDPDDDNPQDPQDHNLVSAQTSYEVGQAFYFPIGHDNYAANWDREWFAENFLKPVLEHPDVLVIAHNIKFEHQMSLLLGIDMFPKTLTRKVMDTMLMVKALALAENTEPKGESGYEVVVGLKPATKALLAATDGKVHGLLHIDDIKSFKDTVGKESWEVATGDLYKVGAKKGQPKMKTESRFRTFNELPVTKDTVDYGCSDADWALGLFLKLMPMCEAEGIDEVLWELDIPFMMVLGEYELAGWHISREKLEALGVIADKALKGDPEASTEEGRAGLEAILYDSLIDLTSEVTDTNDEGEVIVPEGDFGMGSWRGDQVLLSIKTSKPFNWGSVQHKQWLFYHVLKMDTRDIDRSKTTGLPSTDSKSMDKLINGYAGDNQFMKTLKEKAKYDKINGTYVNGMLPFCRSDTGKIHTNMNLVSTWRLSSKKPNLQNIPRPDNDPMGIRGVFVAPTYDPAADYSHLNIWTKPVSIITEHKLSGLMMYANADYAQIELKVLAWYAGEQGMIDILAGGGDLHSWVAQKVFNLACEVEEVKEKFKPFRYQAKAVNFGLVYGLTEYGLSKDPKMGMTVSQAEQFIDEYMATFPGVREYAKNMIAFARANGYVETLFRHRRPIPEINHPNKWIRQKGDNKAMNTPIQGSASDIIRMAMVNIRREQPRWFKGIMQIHDEIQSEVPVEYAVEGCDFLQNVMDRPIEGFSDIMPITSEPAVGATWDTALELKRKPDGTPFVKPKEVQKEATDVTYNMIAPYERWYKLAGIEIA